jgi:hypothetical protein
MRTPTVGAAMLAGLLSFALGSLGGCATTTAPPGAFVHELRRTVPPMTALARTPLARRWLEHALALPYRAPRDVYKGPFGRVLDAEAFAALPPGEQAGYTHEVLDDRAYYALYSTPLSYAPIVDLAAEHGLETLDGARVIDFGYGNIGQIQMSSLAGAHVVGVDPNPTLPVLYGRPEDVDFPPGDVVLVHDRFPTSTVARERVGRGAQLFMSKNTLKRGYVHPEPGPGQTVNPRHVIDLGVDDARFLAAVADALEPGGLFVLYNLCPPPAAPTEPQNKPWADGRSPFTRDALEAAGFEVLAFDVDASVEARRMGHALGWDAGEEPMDLERELFTWYTVARRRR